MNILKPMRLIVIGIILLFLVSLGVSLLIPSHIKISRAIDIHSEKDSVYKLIANPEEWHLWNPVFSSANQLNYKNIAIVPLTQNDSIVLFRLEQSGKQPVLNGWQFYAGGPGTVTVQWYMDITLKWYPWEKLKSLFFENTYGMMMQEGLNNLKTKAESH